MFHVDQIYSSFIQTFVSLVIMMAAGAENFGSQLISVQNSMPLTTNARHCRNKVWLTLLLHS